MCDCHWSSNTLGMSSTMVGVSSSMMGVSSTTVGVSSSISAVKSHLNFLVKFSLNRSARFTKFGLAVCDSSNALKKICKHRQSQRSHEQE